MEKLSGRDSSGGTRTAREGGVELELVASNLQLSAMDSALATPAKLPPVGLKLTSKLSRLGNNNGSRSDW